MSVVGHRYRYVKHVLCRGAAPFAEAWARRMREEGGVLREFEGVRGMRG